MPSAATAATAAIGSKPVGANCFYEKTGCINNTKQKTWLKAAGHSVERFSILEHPWQADELRGNNPADWFKPTAPVIRSGELPPDSFTEDDALKAMIETPILIKLPLMEIGNLRLQGFDKVGIDRPIGLNAVPGEGQIVSQPGADNQTICPRVNNRCD